MEPSGLLSHPARLAGTSMLRLQSDERLVALARAGHEPAFDAIVHRYRPALLRYCAKLLGPERGEDAVQQALASAHTAMTSGDDRDLRLRPWLYRIAHNTALNFLRGARRDEVELDAAAFAAAHTPEDQLAQRERLESVLRAVAALPPAQRDALLLRELEGRSHEEIARALGVSSGAARATLFRARAAVRTACTALTPSGLMLRLAEAGLDGPSHVAAKAVAGVVASAVIVGGGASTGVLRHDHPRRATAQQAHADTRPARTTPSASAPAATTPAKATAGSEPVAALKATAPAAPATATTPKRKRHRAARPAGDVRRADRRHAGQRDRSGRGAGEAADDHGAPSTPAAPTPQARRSGRHADDHAPPRSEHDRGRSQPAQAQSHAAHGQPEADRGSTEAAHGSHGNAHAQSGRDHGQSERDHGQSEREHGRAPADRGRPAESSDQAIEGVSGRRASAASMSDSENSGSSRDPDR